MKKKIRLKEVKLKKSAGEKVAYATIVDNNVYCSSCNEHDYRICDYKLMDHNGTKVYRFVMRCTCGALNKFCSNIGMENEIRSIINDKELSEMRDTSKVEEIEEEEECEDDC